MKHHDMAQFEIAALELHLRRPKGVLAQDWAEMAQSARLNCRLEAMTDFERMSALDVLEICPPGIGVDDWVAMTEAERVVSMNWAAQPPEACGPEIPAAPARGAMRLARPVRMALDAKGNWAAQEDGWQGRAAAIEADAFDLMSRTALRKGQPVPFSGVQIDTGRQYRALVEFRAAGAMKLSSIEGRAGGSGSGGSDYLDRFRQAGEDLARMQRGIGDGVAMEVRRVRPSKRGTAARGIITDRALVDAVCLSGRTLNDVLRDSGWSLFKDHRDALRAALLAALDRMHEGSR